jgi:hypothetical protein
MGSRDTVDEVAERSKTKPNADSFSPSESESDAEPGMGNEEIRLAKLFLLCGYSNEESNSGEYSPEELGSRSGEE